jgi:hypothetical protein
MGYISQFPMLPRGASRRKSYQFDKVVIEIVAPEALCSIGFGVSNYLATKSIECVFPKILNNVNEIENNS